MRIKLTIAVFVVLLFGSGVMAQGVEHAPTVEQCRADARLWSHKLSRQPVDAAMATVNVWLKEMSECRDVDQPYESDYLGVLIQIEADEARRFIHFIKRAGLANRFEAEDAAGKR